MSTSYVIIGTSAASIGALNRIVSRDLTATITCISDEKEFPYNKCFLADYMSGVKPVSALYTKPRSFFEENRIQLMLGTRISEILPGLKAIRTQEGATITYDKLLLGLGSSPRTFVIPGMQGAANVFTFHTLRDALALQNYISTHRPKQAVIIGAGLSGLECADSLTAHGITSTVVEMQPRMLHRCIDQGASDFIARCMAKRALRFIKGHTISHARGHGTAVTTVMLDDGTELTTDMVVVATGLRGNYDIAYQAGLACSAAGITVNESMQTSDAAIWAAGDCVAICNLLNDQIMSSTTWPDAMAQGMVAGAAMVGESFTYKGSVPMLSSSFFGINFISMGNVLHDQGFDVIVKEGNDFYHRFVLEQQRLKGFLLVNHTHMAPRLKRAMLTQQPIDADLLYRSS